MESIEGQVPIQGKESVGGGLEVGLMVEKLDQLSPWPGVERDSEHQERVLSQLPKNLPEQMMAHILAVQTEADIYNDAHGKPRETIPDKPLIVGRLFEMITAIEDQELREDLAGLEDLQKQEIMDAEKELLVMMSNPNRTVISEGRNCSRNPDLALLRVTKEGRIVIVQVGEAKTGFLDRRAWSQLKPKGFRKTAQETTQLLDHFLTSHNLTDLAEAGLPALAKLMANRGQGVEVAADLKQLLVLTADKDINNPDGIVVNSGFHKRDRERFVGLLSSPEVEIRQSIFTSAEIAALADLLREGVLRLRGRAKKTALENRDKMTPEFRLGLKEYQVGDPSEIEQTNFDKKVAVCRAGENRSRLMAEVLQDMGHEAEYGGYENGVDNQIDLQKLWGASAIFCATRGVEQMVRRFLDRLSQELGSNPEEMAEIRRLQGVPVRVLGLIEKNTGRLINDGGPDLELLRQVIRDRLTQMGVQDKKQTNRKSATPA